MDLCVLLCFSVLIFLVPVQADIRLPPSISSPRSPEKLYFKQSVNTDTLTVLACEAEGSPAPQIYWKKYGVQVEESQYIKFNTSDGELAITNPVEEDEGVYQCFATNKWGTSVSQPVHFIMAQIEQGHMMSFNDDRTILTIQDVSRDRDLMCIQCNISNSIGSIFSDAYLNVLEPIKILSRPSNFIIFEHGEVLNFTIKATTDPSQTLSRRWSLNNKPLVLHQSYFMYDEQSGEFYFNTSKVAFQDIESMTGEYRCELSHQHQRITVAFTIATSKPTTEKNSTPVAAARFTYIIPIILGLLVVIL